MDNILDIFNSDAYSIVQLTAAINKLPFVPGRAGSLGVFEENGVPTTSIVVEQRGNILVLIPATDRGGPANQMPKNKRSARNFNVPHLPLEDKVLASEVQNVRAFGGSQLQGVQQVVNDKLQAMTRSHDATVEFQRIGAIKGQILDADGSTVIYDLFTEFGVSQTTVDFVLDTAGTNVQAKCLAVKRAIEAELGAGQDSVKVHCFCGKDYFDSFTGHAAVKDAFQRWIDAGQPGAFLRQDGRRGFEFMGITFEEYPGTVSGVDFVADDEAHFFPVNVPGLFITRYAPGDFMETANTIGLPRYARQEPFEYNRGVKLLTESNPLSMCTQPKVLVKGLRDDS